MVRATVRRIALALVALLALPVLASAQQAPPPPGPNPATASATITSAGGAATITPLAGQNVCTIDVQGTWTGTLQVQAGTSWTNSTVTPYQSATTQVGITANGLYQTLIPSAIQARIIGPTATGSATVYLVCAYYGGATNAISTVVQAVSTPSAAPLPTASAGTTPPPAAVDVLANEACMSLPYPPTTNASAGNRIAAYCDPKGARMIAGRGSSGPFEPVYCDQHTELTALSVNTATELVAATAGKSIYVCQWEVFALGTGLTNTVLYQATPTCTGLAAINALGANALTTQEFATAPWGSPLVIVPATLDVCVQINGASLSSSEVVMTYAKF